MQVLDRKFAPLPWAVQREKVAADCRWSHRDLAVAFPGWRMNGSAATGFDAQHNGAMADPRYPARRQLALSKTGMGLRGRTYEVAVGSSFNNAPQVSVFSPDVPNFPTGPASIIVHYRKLDTTNRLAVIFAMNGNGVSDYLHAFTNATGDLTWDYGGATVGTSRLQVSSLTFGDDVWAFTTGARGMEIWQNGILRASNGGNPTRVNSANYWGLFAGIIWASDFAESGCCLLYNRQLEIEAIRALTLDPWTPFRPQRIGRTARATAAASSTARSFVPAFIG